MNETTDNLIPFDYNKMAARLEKIALFLEEYENSEFDWEKVKKELPDVRAQKYRDARKAFMEDLNFIKSVVQMKHDIDPESIRLLKLFLSMSNNMKGDLKKHMIQLIKNKSQIED